MIRKYQWWAKGQAHGIKASFTSTYQNDFELEKDAFWNAAEGTLKIVQEICPAFMIEDNGYNAGLKVTTYPTLKQLTKEPKLK